MKAKTYLVEVELIAKNSARPLSYFSTAKLPPGTVVKVPVKKGFSYGVVTNSKSALSAKSQIRRAGFSLKKIAQRDVATVGFSPEFLESVKQTAFYYAAGTGALLFSLLPKIVLEEPEKFLTLPQPRQKDIAPKETFLLQMETEERFGQYRGLVRQAFARNASVLFVVPTHNELARAAAELSQGIKPYVYLFATHKPKEAKLAWVKALNDPHPVLFITTGAGVAFDRRDVDTIIIERENSRAYRTLTRPYFHFKVFLEQLAKHSGRQLVMGDSVLSVETLWKEKRGDYGELSLIRWRLPAAPAQLVDVSAKPNKDGKFEIISSELKTLIAKALEEKEKIFLFGARKGLAPTTICGDCGYILPCLNCGAPVVLHQSRRSSAQANVYICHACGTKRTPDTTCGYCGSWKLVPLGIGIERIASEARQLFHRSNVEILDKDHAPTEAKVKSIVKKFNEQGGILVGTELAFFHLEKVPYTALVSADSLFSIPDFGINERIFYLVSRLREMTQKETIIQTRNIGKQVLAWSTQGNIIDFYLNEIGERKDLSYPPFSIFIKITSLTNRSDALIGVKDRLWKWRPETYKDSLIMRIPREEWPNRDLVEALFLLGPQFSIKVDPESIL